MPFKTKFRKTNVWQIPTMNDETGDKFKAFLKSKTVPVNCLFQLQGACKYQFQMIRYKDFKSIKAPYFLLETIHQKY